jgi:hypothetical protein
MSPAPMKPNSDSFLLKIVMALACITDGERR